MIVPILHRILVRQFKLVEEDKTYKSARAAGIHLIESDQMGREQAGVDRGTVVSVGGTAFKDFGVDSPVAVGDMVAFARYSGKLLKDPFTDEEFIALNDEDIIAIYKE